MSDVALLHYWLTNMRGGENVLAEIAGMFPSADIYTHAYAENEMKAVFGTHPVFETFIGKLPGAVKHCQKYLPLMPLALKKLDLSGYRLIISSESGPAKGIRKPAHATHICYCHTPMRYLWDMHQDYYSSAGLAGKIAMKLFTPYLRRYDLASADSVDHFIANSGFVAERIHRIYNREAAVIYPPVNVEYFSSGPAEEKGDFYLFAGQLTGYKRPDLALEACLKRGRKLLFAGDGDCRKELEKRAAGNPDIVFAGACTKEELRRYYRQARALLFPGTEDFGIVPVEAQAAGIPVIAYARGGALETVRSGETGLFFDRQTVDSLAGAMEEFEGRGWDQEKCRRNAAGFSAELFRAKFRELLDGCRRI